MSSRSKRIQAGFALVVTLLLVWFGCSSAQQVVIGYSVVSSLLLPYWVGKEAGFYNQERLDERLVYIPSSSTMAQAMLAGNVAISSANSQVVVEIGLQGGDLITMGSVINVAAFYVMAPPEIRSVADLKGKPVGVTRFGASTDFGIRQLLKKHGLEPVKNVPVLQLSGMPELAAALSKVQKLEKIKIYSPNSDHRRAFAAEWEKKLGLPIIAVDEPRCVVVGSDVVIIVNSKAQI